jgi:hypothetical protein
VIIDSATGGFRPERILDFIIDATIGGTPWSASAGFDFGFAPHEDENHSLTNLKGFLLQKFG